jgi:hypothetical protein
MPAITLKGTTGTIKSRQEGSNVVVEKTIDKAVITETHKGEGKRVKGKQAPGKPITLTAAEVKGFGNNTETRIKEAVKVGKEENKKAIAALNEMANQYGATLEKKHQEESKKMTKNMNVLTAKLVQTKQTNKTLAKKPEVERVKAGMNAFANDMLKKVTEEHEAELKKAVDRKTEYMKSTKRLRQERNEYKTEAERLKASITAMEDARARGTPFSPQPPTQYTRPELRPNTPAPARARSSNSSA